jgi:hypothetical protein
MHPAGASHLIEEERNRQVHRTQACNAPVELRTHFMDLRLEHLINLMAFDTPCPLW